MLHMYSISIKCDAQSKAWDFLLVLTSVAGNLCNKCPSGYSNKTAVKVILSMQSLVSIEQQSPRRPCDTHLLLNVLPIFLEGDSPRSPKYKNFPTPLIEQYNLS